MNYQSRLGRLLWSDALGTGILAANSCLLLNLVPRAASNFLEISIKAAGFRKFPYSSFCAFSFSRSLNAGLKIAMPRRKD